MTRLTTPLLAAALLAGSAFADMPEAAKLAPPDAAVFVQVDDFKSARADWESDPLGRFIRQTWPMPQNEGWLLVQAVMGMTGPQIMDTYFGDVVAAVAKETGDNKPGVVFTKVKPDDIELAKARLELREVGDVGAFKTYTTADGKGRFAFNAPWMAISGPEHAEYANLVMENAGKSPTLAENEEFKTWLGKLPAERSAVLFARNPATQEVHAAAARRSGRSVTLHYAGHPKDAAQMVTKLGDAGALEFGPLPDSTLAAVTLNLYDPDPRDTAMLDRLLAPKTFKADVLPKLAAPVVLFLGEVKGAALEPNPGMDVPVVGMVVKLKDHAVAAELDRVFNGLMLVANIATAKWGVPPINISTVRGNADHSYTVADIGAALAAHLKRPELAAVKLTYGRIGDWYVVTTQDQFYSECLASQGNGAAAATTAPISHFVKNLPLREMDQPVGAMFLRGKDVAAHLQTWLDHWQKTRPELFAAAATQPGQPEAKVIRSVTRLQGVLQHIDAVTVQFRHEEENVFGEMHVVRE